MLRHDINARLERLEAKVRREAGAPAVKWPDYSYEELAAIAGMCTGDILEDIAQRPVDADGFSPIPPGYARAIIDATMLDAACEG